MDPDDIPLDVLNERVQGDRPFTLDDLIDMDGCLFWGLMWLFVFAFEQVIYTIYQFINGIFGGTTIIIQKGILRETDTLCCIISIRNVSFYRDVGITEIWFDCDFPRHWNNPDRLLPVCIEPGKSWTTWVPFVRLPTVVCDNPRKYIRVRLSTGKVVKPTPLFFVKAPILL